LGIGDLSEAKKAPFDKEGEEGIEIDERGKADISLQVLENISQNVDYTQHRYNNSSLHTPASMPLS
jgi:hypothetical protein